MLKSLRDRKSLTSQGTSGYEIFFPLNMFSIIHSLLMIQVLSDCKCFLCGEAQQIKENN